MNIRPGYTFDDVLLVPRQSNITSRKNVSLQTHLGSDKKVISLEIPIVSANMKTVTGAIMARKIAELGGLAILHRFCSVEERIECFHRQYSDNIGVSVGVNLNDRASVVPRLSDTGVKIVCVDVAHGHHELAANMVNYISNKFPHMLIIAGNVATASGFISLAEAGANVVKVGVGPGSLCTTRVETGNGVPQLTALDDIYSILTRSEKYSNVQVIADGGVKCAGDVVKALCFSHAVMLGNVLAGTDEAPGEIITVDNRQYKTYAGSSTHKTSHVEGVTGLVPCKGPVANVISKLLEGVRSGMSYQGANNLEELRHNPQFISISHAGLVESKPHDVVVR